MATRTLLKKYLIGILFLIGLLGLGLSVYAYQGWRDGISLSVGLKAKAKNLQLSGRGHDALSQAQRQTLIRVQDPAFYTHDGTDGRTPGSGQTTITQSLAKRVGFENFRPGLGKIRQTAMAKALETQLSKDEILTLFINETPMGRGPDGKWVSGLSDAAQNFYGQPLSDLSQVEYRTLIAVMIAPGRFNVSQPSPDLDKRRERIDRLMASECEIKAVQDVWLEACAMP